MWMPVGLRYALLQLPEIAMVAVVLWLLTDADLIGSTTAVLALGFWVLKDVALYPFYRHALRDDIPAGTALLRGRQAVVKLPLAPCGQVLIDGERWQARTADGSAISVGKVVRIVDADGLVLIVEAV